MYFRIGLLVNVALILGCGSAEKAEIPSDHDADEAVITEADVQMPATYAEAVPRIKSYRDAIRKAIEAGTPDKAHRPLDELDIVLNKLPAIAKESRIPIEQWETINLAAQELRGLFDRVHLAIDEKRAPDFNAVAKPIQQAVVKLEQVTP